MKIFLSYGYRPFTTAVYFEKALKQEHEVHYIGPPYGQRAGYLPNEDAWALTGELGTPDLFLFIEPGINFFPRGLEKFTCPTASYLVDVHCDLRVRETYAPFFDYLFICHKDYVNHFQVLGYPQVYWLPVACDPEIHGEQASQRIYDIGFVGQRGAPEHPRSRILRELAATYKINDYQRFYPKEEITSIYSRSKIVVNIPSNKDLNMRTFEAMAAGALLITEAIQNGQPDLFQDGVHLVEYRSEADLLKKVAFYLQHEEERERIAKAGQDLVLAEHIYKKRCDFILETIFGQSSPVRAAKVREMSEKDLRVSTAKVYSMLKLADPIFQEIETAHRQKNLSFKLIIELIKTILKKMNAIFLITPSIRRLFKSPT